MQINIRHFPTLFIAECKLIVSKSIAFEIAVFEITAFQLAVFQCVLFLYL